MVRGVLGRLWPGPEGFTSFSEGHSLEGKIALVFRFEPMNEKGKSLWSEGEGWSGRAGFAGKIGAVAKRKPAAIIVVNTPGADDPRIDSLTTAGGGRAMADLIDLIFRRAFDNPLLNQGNDQAAFDKAYDGKYLSYEPVKHNDYKGIVDLITFVDELKKKSS